MNLIGIPILTVNAIRSGRNVRSPSSDPALEHPQQQKQINEYIWRHTKEADYALQWVIINAVVLRPVFSA